MNQDLYEKLKGVARSQSVITYSDIASLVGVDIQTSLGRREIGRLIAEVCAHEVEHGRPMLGSVVVRKDTGMPGDGYSKGRQSDDHIIHTPLSMRDFPFTVG